MKIERKKNKEEFDPLQKIINAFDILPTDETLIVTLDEADYFDRYDIERELRKLWRKRRIDRPIIFEVRENVIAIGKSLKPAANWICDVCGETFLGKGLNPKYEHFKSIHPEYAFKRERRGMNYLYWCSTCDTNVPNFGALVRHYKELHAELL